MRHGAVELWARWLGGGFSSVIVLSLLVGAPATAQAMAPNPPPDPCGCRATFITVHGGCAPTNQECRDNAVYALLSCEDHCQATSPNLEWRPPAWTTVVRARIYVRRAALWNAQSRATYAGVRSDAVAAADADTDDTVDTWLVDLAARGEDADLSDWTALEDWIDELVVDQGAGDFVAALDADPCSYDDAYARAVAAAGGAQGAPALLDVVVLDWFLDQLGFRKGLVETGGGRGAPVCEVSQ